MQNSFSDYETTKGGQSYPEVVENGHGHEAPIAIANEWQYASSPPPAEKQPISEQEATICGLRRATFWLSVALAVAVIVAVVGGGVGGTVAMNDKNRQLAAASAALQSQAPTGATATVTVTSAAKTATKTATKTAAKATVTVSAAYSTPTLGCPDRNGQNFTASEGGKYTIICHENFGGNDLTGSGTEFPELFLDSFDTCMDTCDAWNANETFVATSGQCVGAIFAATSGNDFVKWAAGMCWLKSKMGTGAPDSRLVSGKLLNG